MNLAKVPTYHAGIAQSKAYRVLRQFMGELLRNYNLTMMQWSIVGLVYDAGASGIRITDLARQLDTTMAFVTTNINMLVAGGYVQRTVDAKDTRSRIVAINPDAQAKVIKIEQELRASMRDVLYKEIDPTDLASYVKVLNQIANLYK
jgi:DNA-binding MarR family transcriptional regulator